MTSSYGYYNNTCPSAPAITVSSTTIEIGNGVLQWEFESLSFDVDNIASLTHIPISPKDVLVLRNGVGLFYGTDYLVSSDQVRLLFAPEASDSIYAQYQYTTDAYSTAAGNNIQYYITTIPSGFIELNGVHTIGNEGSGATYAGAAYEDVYEEVKDLLGDETSVFDDGDVITVPKILGSGQDGDGNIVGFKGAIRV